MLSYVFLREVLRVVRWLDEAVTAVVRAGRALRDDFATSTLLLLLAILLTYTLLVRPDMGLLVIMAILAILTLVLGWCRSWRV
jgi:uncharacterized membrane protein HdeD (DUF308 family)